VWIIIVIYTLLALCVILLPVWAALTGNDPGVFGTSVAISTTFALSGLGLMLTPVRAARRRRLTRRSIWIPLLASGFLIGVLFVAVAFALIEYAKAPYPLDENTLTYAILVGGGVIWFDWAILLWMMTRRHDPNLLAGKLHRWLFAGSVAELLVAVPTHLVVRRRSECCAGMMTGTAICVGVVVMFLSLGPGVAMLYFRRWQQVRAPAREIRSD
jgi:hypothetical protein